MYDTSLHVIFFYKGEKIGNGKNENPIGTRQTPNVRVASVGKSQWRKRWRIITLTKAEIGADGRD